MMELLSLEIENFRSFHRAQSVDFGWSPSRKIAALYGANASGKSNVIKALKAAFACISQSAIASWRLPYEPFALNVKSAEKPTRFKIDFRGKTRFSYEFSFLRDRIVSEALQEFPQGSKKPKTIFKRDASGSLNSTAAKHKFGKRLLGKTRPDTLLVTKAREDNNEFANIIFDLLRSVTIVDDSDMGPAPWNPGYMEMLKRDRVLRGKTVDLLNKCDFAIRGIEVKSVPLPKTFFDPMPIEFPAALKQEILSQGATEINTIHAVRDDEGSVVDMSAFDFMSMESMGTKKFFEVAVPIIDAIDNEKTILIDGFSTYIHPNLAGTIIRLFGEQPSEGRGAKLVLITHNTAMMSELSRDEIILVEKTLSEESRVVPLAKAGARKDDHFEKKYRAGHYGGVPLIME